MDLKLIRSCISIISQTGEKRPCLQIQSRSDVLGVRTSTYEFWVGDTNQPITGLHLSPLCISGKTNASTSYPVSGQIAQYTSGWGGAQAKNKPHLSPILLTESKREAALKISVAR